MLPTVVCEGFGALRGFPDDNTKSTVATLEGDSLIIRPPAKSDFWRKTYYEPVLLADKAPFLYYPLQKDTFYTVETTFNLTADCQFDQAG